MVLNGAYVYCRTIAPSFSRYKLLKFCSYYDNVRIGKYITVLTCNGFIEENGMYKGHQLFSISEKGIQVMKEFDISYKIELDKFVSVYGISL